MSLPVTVVTVAFGNPEVVRKWVERWLSTGAACLIADNGNQITKDIQDMATVLPFTGNQGFGMGINRAVQESDSSVVLITNPDTLPENSGSLSALLDFHSRGSLTGGFTIDSSGKEVHSTGTWPTGDWVRSQIFSSAKTLWQKDHFDWLQGSLIMVHRDDFLRLDGFSSRYPLYFEDVDLCARAADSGMKINLCKTEKFIHDEGSGSAKATATRLSCFHWGLLELFKMHDPANAEAVRRMIIAKCVLRMAAYTLINPRASRGYYRALRAVISGIPPELPRGFNV